MELEKLAEYIARAPESWGGVSLLYLRLPDADAAALETVIAEAAGSSAGTLAFRGSSGECVLLGAEHRHEKLAAVAVAYVWIDDIAAQQRLACGIIAAMSRNMAPAGRQAALPSGKVPLSILIVEDDPMTSQLVAHHLKQCGSLTMTGNSREAVANYMVHRPDLVFLDIHYRGDRCDGFDVLANLLSADAAAFVVMFSSDRDPGTILKALSLGAEGFIAKPFRVSDFAHYLARAGGAPARRAAS